MTDTRAKARPWDEMRDADGAPRPAAEEVLAVIDRLGVDELRDLLGVLAPRLLGVVLEAQVRPAAQSGRQLSPRARLSGPRQLGPEHSGRSRLSSPLQVRPFVHDRPYGPLHVGAQGSRGRVNEQHTAGQCNRHSILHSCRYVFPNDLCLDVSLLRGSVMVRAVPA